MTDARAATEMIDYRRVCGFGDRSAFQGSLDRPPCPWTRPSISPDSSVSRAVAVVFGGPDLALEPANRVRRSHSSPLSDRFVPRSRSSFIETVARYGISTGLR